MQLEGARFTGLPSTTKPSTEPKTRKNYRTPLRRWYWRSSQQRYPQVYYSSLARLEYNQSHLRKTSFESASHLSKLSAFSYETDCCKCFSNLNAKGLDASSSRPPADLQLFTEGSEFDNDDHNSCRRFIGSFGTQKSREKSSHDVDENGESYVTRYIPPGTTRNLNPADFRVSYHKHDHDDLETNDLEFATGLDDACTAFRVKSREYNHATTCAWFQSMENRRGRKASKEKEKDFCAFELQNCRKETYWTTGNVDVVGIRSTHITKRKFSIHEDEASTTASLDIYVRARENGAARDAASFDAYSVIDFSSPECPPYDVLNNTAFTDDDDYDDKIDDGDNEVDYDNYDDADGFIDNYNDYGSTNCCVFWSKVEKFDSDTSRRSVSTGLCRLDNTKKSCDLWHGFEKLVEEEKYNSFDNCDKDCYGRIVETGACVDVPGGRLCTDINPSRSSIHGSGLSSMGNEDNLVFSKKYQKTEHVDYKFDKSRDYDGRYPGRSHECEKWKRPRRRRRRKCAKNKERFIGECCDGYGNSDDRILLAEECNVEYCKRDEEENVYTARLGGTVTRVEGKHKRKSKWSSEFNENLAKTQEDKSAKGPCSDNLKTRRQGVERKYKGAGTGSKRDARSYGLLFVLYLLALPILCSTDSSGPVAAAFAQKSPLTHSDNFTTRNSSLQHQGHQMRRDGGSGHDSSHPYNEYTWEVNQINPWLSACDLAGPAPADLQGSCGPPEVPKNCPIQCTTKSQTDGDWAFHEVIERLGVHDRAKTGAGGSRWRPAGTTTTINKKNNNKDENGNKRTEETVTAPEQCLFYLEESHKRIICRDKFGRGSSLSFSNPRENRYWFMSGLRLRHCCEHPVVNALAPGKGGPLEDVLNGGRKCAEALDKLLLVDALAARLHCEFEEVLARYDCAQPYSVIHNCTHCKEAYRKWVCSSLVPYFAHGGPPALETSANAWSGTRLRPCRSFCQSVEQRCPYLLPGDRAPAYPTQYAGEPTFLCRDPNIPETGEQAMRALHGNEEEECCFHVCSEIEPGSGVCANCTDRRPHSHHAGHDASTAPQCEITSTSPIQSVSTGHQNSAEVSGSSSHGSLESATASSSPSTTTSASSCGGGGVGSMSSSSGQSTTQTPPPSSISLICLFWIWAALISLCTGQAVFPWVPPSSLLMLDHSSSGGAISSQRSSSDYPRNKKNFSSSSSSSISSRNIVKVAASWWSCSLSAPSLSSIPPRSSASSRPRFRKFVLQLARVFLISLTKTIHDCLRSFVNLFLVLLDSLLRNCVKCHYWHRRLWRYAWCGTICSRWFRQKFNKPIFVEWNLSNVCKERGWTEGPGYCCCCCCCCLKGIWCCDSNNNEPRPPRGRRRKRRRGRRRRRRRRHRRFLSHLHTLQLPLLIKLLRPLWNLTIVTGPACIAGLTLLVMNRRYYYGDASTWLRWWYYCFYRSQRHSYSYFKRKGPS